MNNVRLSTITLRRALVYIRQNRKQIFVFMVCFCVSLLLWLTIKLNRHYVHTVMFRVNIHGLQSDQKIFPMQPDTVILELKAQGYQLLFNRITMAKGHEISLNQAFMNTYTQPGIIYVTSRSLLARISSQFPVTTELLSIKPDTLFYRIDNMVHRKVMVIPDLSISFKPGYNLTDTIRVVPDSVVIHGPKRLLQTIESVKTEPLVLRMVDQEVNRSIQLLNPFAEEIKLQPNSVLLKCDVTRFVEKTFFVPVVLTTHADQHGTPNTRMTEIRCMIPYELSASFDTDSLQVTTGKVVSDANGHYALLEVLRCPEYVKNIRLKPDRITFLREPE